MWKRAPTPGLAERDVARATAEGRSRELLAAADGRSKELLGQGEGRSREAIGLGEAARLAQTGLAEAATTMPDLPAPPPASVVHGRAREPRRRGPARQRLRVDVARAPE